MKRAKFETLLWKIQTGAHKQGLEPQIFRENRGEIGPGKSGPFPADSDWGLSRTCQGLFEIAPKGPFLVQLAPFGPSPCLLSPRLDFPDLQKRHRIAVLANCTLPRIAGLESPEILQREAKKKLSRSKVESRNIDSESPSESHPINAESDLGIAGLESHDPESLDSQFRIADSVPLSLRLLRVSGWQLEVFAYANLNNSKLVHLG